MERLLAHPRDYDFFQLVRMLLREDPAATPPGGEGPPRRENVRFRPAAHLGFAPSDVDVVEVLPAAEDEPARFRVTVNFMGLYGPASPMPNHVTEDILWAGVDGVRTRRQTTPPTASTAMPTMTSRPIRVMRYPVP